MQYRREIDGLRALAVIPVMLYHANIPLFQGGFVGVDVFFVISGYLITSLIAGEIEAGSFSLLRFYERRVRRIAPALVLVMAVCIPFAWLLFFPPDFNNFARSLAPVSLGYANIFFWQHLSYFGPSAESLPLIHTWSLSVEEQFYLLFPLLMISLWPLGRRTLVRVVLYLGLASFGLAQFSAYRYPTTAFFFLHTRAWELFLGAYLVMKETEFEVASLKRISKESLAIFGLISILASSLTFNSNLPYPSVWTLLPTIGAALVINFADKNTLAGRFLSTSLLFQVGLISYSAYLWHQPLFVFAAALGFGNSDLLMTIVILLIALGLAYLSWRYVELPFRNRNWLTRRQVFSAAAIASVGFVLVGAVSPRFNDMRLAKVLPERSDALQLTDRCFLYNVGAEALDVSACAGHGQHKVLLLGDSHAASLYPGLKEALSKNQIELGMMTSVYCVPLVEEFPPNSSITATPRCADINRKIHDYIKQNDIDLIVISAHMLQWQATDYLRFSYKGCYDDIKSALREIAAGKAVLVIGQFPTWRYWLPYMFLSKSSNKIDDMPQYSDQNLDPHLFDFDRVYGADVRSLGIRYLSVTDFMCPNHECLRWLHTDTGVQLETYDYAHLGLAASRYLSRELVAPEILKLVVH
jgi:peptidoglycan/LPS O-acetylase OafA/YrhL